jgi:aquaporin TIP
MDTDKNSLRPYMAELLGTFAVVFLTAGAVLVNQLAAFTWHTPAGLAVVTSDEASAAAHPVVIGQPALGLVGIALTAGCAYAAALAVTLPISGGFLNPAITLMLWVFKRLDGARTFWLLLTQGLGALLAGLLLRLLFAAREDVLVAGALGTPHLNLDAFGAAGTTLSVVLLGIAVELVLTFLLVFVVFATVIDPRGRAQAGGWANRLAALWLGLVVAAATFVGFGLTGAALNPARWFGTVFWEMTVTPLLTRGPWQDNPVYWIGPIVGALLAGGLYSTLILPVEETAAPAETPAPAGRGAVTSTLYRARK